MAYKKLLEMTIDEGRMVNVASLGLFNILN